MSVTIVMIVFLFFVFVMKLVNGANILAVTLLPANSHGLWHEAYFKGLIQKGHNVTVLTHIKPGFTSINYTVLEIKGIYEAITKPYISYSSEELKKLGPVNLPYRLWTYCHNVCKYDINSNEVSILMNYPKSFKFDLIIWDIHMGQCLYPLIEIFGNPPVIATSPFGNVHFIQDITSQPIQSYIPHFMTIYEDNMNFLERVINLVYIVSTNWLRRYYFLSLDKTIANNYFGNNIRPFEDIERNISLLLVNNDNFINFPQPLAPNVITVGGLQIQNAQKLPKDLENIFEKSRGVILFAMGSNLDPTKFENSTQKAIIDTLAELHYNIIWKCDCTHIELPPNVITRKWLPQNDILGHPKTILLITHGGVHSLQEAVFHGVPMISMPMYLDQFTNTARIQSLGIGRSLDYHNLTKENILENVAEVIRNPTYKKKIHDLSLKYRNRLNHPLDVAIHWTEYILKHGGAEELDIAARDMYFYQITYLDMFCLIFFGVLMASVILYRILTECIKKNIPIKNHKKKGQ